MLKKSKADIINEVKWKISNNLNSLFTEDGEGGHHTTNYFTSEWDQDFCSNIDVPASHVGWPPELGDYIRRVAIATAIAVIDSVYTEKELEERVESIILEDEDN